MTLLLAGAEPALLCTTVLVGANYTHQHANFTNHFRCSGMFQYGESKLVPYLSKNQTPI
jgi:hypothetical protein